MLFPLKIEIKLENLSENKLDMFEEPVFDNYDDLDALDDDDQDPDFDADKLMDTEQVRTDE